MTAPVTVLVPVYKGLADVQACLESVVRHGAEAPFELLVIDDASPQAAVAAYVDQFGASEHGVPVRVLRNPENLGFVRTVNRGLRETQGDVVILNADTAGDRRVARPDDRGGHGRAGRRDRHAAHELRLDLHAAPHDRRRLRPRR